jgi:hypothetical protein
LFLERSENCEGVRLRSPALSRGFNDVEPTALVNVNPGYDARNVMTFQIILPSGHATSPGRLYDEVLSRLDADPTVQAVGATDVLPMAGASAFHFALGGLPVSPGPDHQMVMRIVSRQTFKPLA